MNFLSWLDCEISSAAIERRSYFQSFLSTSYHRRGKTENGIDTKEWLENGLTKLLFPHQEHKQQQQEHLISKLEKTIEGKLE